VNWLFCRHKPEQAIAAKEEFTKAKDGNKVFVVRNTSVTVWRSRSLPPKPVWTIWIPSFLG